MYDPAFVLVVATAHEQPAVIKAVFIVYQKKIGDKRKSWKL